jgi:hypothetical protein
MSKLFVFSATANICFYTYILTFHIHTFSTICGGAHGCCGGLVVHLGVGGMEDGGEWRQLERKKLCHGR